MSLTRVLLFMTTILSSSQATQCPNSDGRCSSFVASRYPNNYLGCESLVNTLQVNNVTACIRNCLRTPFCFSTNFKQSKCELLRSTRTTRPKHCLLQKEGWEHIEVAHHENCGGETPCIKREGWYSASTAKCILPVLSSPTEN